jgi:transmembrane sensor
LEQPQGPGSAAPAAVAWRQDAIVIRDRRFAEALAEIGRYRAGRIMLLGDASPCGQVTARLALSDLDGGIDALAATSGLSVTRVTGYLMIVRSLL